MDSVFRVTYHYPPNDSRHENLFTDVMKAVPFYISLLHGEVVDEVEISASDAEWDTYDLSPLFPEHVER